MRLRRALLATVLALTAVTGTTATSQADVGADTDPSGAAELERVAGGTRNDTAAKAARRAFPDGADEALIARSDDFPDALAAAYLAGVRDAPVLLTDRDAIPSVTLDALEALGVEEVTLLGGTTAIPTPIEEAFDRTYGEENVARIAGGDRFETASLVARAGGNRVGEAPDLSDPEGERLRTAIVSLGTNFPDALSAGPLSAANEHPILLTGGQSLPAITRFTLEDARLDIEQVIVTGGEGAVAEEVVEELEAIGSLDSVVRVAGDTRTSTAVELGLVTRQVTGWDADTIALATGANFPDALTLAPLAARSDATLFLSNGASSLGFATFEGIHDLCNAVDTVLVSGGEVAVGAEAAAQARLATTCADAAFPLTADQVVGDQTGSSETEGTGYVFVDGDDVCHVLGLDLGESAVTPTTFVDAWHGNAIAGDEAASITRLPDPGSGFVAECETNAELASLVTEFPAGHYVTVKSSEQQPPAPCPDDPDCEQPEQTTHVRGQLVPPASLTVQLHGELEVMEDPDGNFLGLDDSPAAGSGELVLSPARGGMCFTVSVRGLDSPTAPAVAGGLHLHEGAVDENGPIAQPLGVGPVGRSDFLHHDCVDADPAVLLSDGDSPFVSGFYANLHTEDEPAGALRGNLVGTPVPVYGDAEVDTSTADSPDFGQGAPGLVGRTTLLVGAEPEEGGQRNVCLDVRWPDGLPDGESLTGAHVHTGHVDENGPVVIGFAGLVDTTEGAACTEVEESVLDDVLADRSGHYVNLHTDAFPGGIARGQMGAELLAFLTGAAEVDPDGALTDVGDATASGLASLPRASDTNPDVVCGGFEAGGLDRVVGAHVHEGEAGENGDVVAGLVTEALPEGAQSGFGCATDVDAAVVADIFTNPGTYYVNVHTETFPQGAIRGQLLTAS